MQSQPDGNRQLKAEDDSPPTSTLSPASEQWAMGEPAVTSGLGSQGQAAQQNKGIHSYLPSMRPQGRATSATDLSQLNSDSSQHISWRQRGPAGPQSSLLGDLQGASSSAPPQHIDASSKVYLAQRLAQAPPAPQQDTMLAALASSFDSDEDLPLQSLCLLLGAYGMLQARAGQLGEVSAQLTRRCCALASTAATQPQQLRQLPPQLLSNLIYGSSVLDLELCKAAITAVVRTPQLLERASAEDLALLAAGLSNAAGLQDTAQAHELREAATSRLHGTLANAANASCQMGHQTLCALLRSLSRGQGLAGSQLTAVLLDEALRHVRQSDTQAVPSVLSSCAAAGQPSLQLAAAAEERLGDPRLVEWPPSAVAEVLNALADLRYRCSDAVLQRAAEFAARWQPVIHARLMTSVLTALARVGFTSCQDLVNSLAASPSCVSALVASEAGILMWSLAVLEASGSVQRLQQSLKQHLNQLPAPEFGEAALVQLFQAHLATRGEHHATVLPPLLSQRCEISWQGHLADWKPSQAVEAVAERLRELSVPHKVAASLDGGLQVAHLLLLGPPALVLQVDGPDAFTCNEPYMPLGQTLLSWRRLQTRNRPLLSIPFYVWSSLGTAARQQAYLQVQLHGAQGEHVPSPPASSGRRSPMQPHTAFSMSSSGAVSEVDQLMQRMNMGQPIRNLPTVAQNPPAHMNLQPEPNQHGGGLAPQDAPNMPDTSYWAPDTSAAAWYGQMPMDPQAGMGDPSRTLPGPHGPSMMAHTASSGLPASMPLSLAATLAMPLSQNPVGLDPAQLPPMPEHDMRRLWASLGHVDQTAFNPMGPGISGAPIAAPTVADLRRIVDSLPLEMSAVSAVAPLLSRISPSQFASLMTELAQDSHAFRAWQLFDWVRGLPDEHPLKALCDAGTYTTMIMLCGTWQQLRRALELVDDMRARSLDCGLQAYTALLTAAVKGGESDLAVEVYRQMGAEGMARDRQVFAVLVDVHVRQGAMREALQVLRDMKNADLEPEVHLYNIILVACTKLSNPRMALEVYQRMLAHGVPPNTKTFTALIGSVGRQAPLQQSLDLVGELLAADSPQGKLSTYTALMAACEKGGLWELALALFQRMTEEGVQPDVGIFNSIIAACAHSGEFSKAQGMFDAMPHHSCRADAVTYANLIRAYKKGGQWCHALATFEAMQASGSQPHTAVFSSIIDVLWQTGILWAQAKALQLFTSAVTAGHLAPAVESAKKGVLKVDLQALTVGVAVLSMAAWLSGARDSILHDPEPSLDTSRKLAIVNGLAEQTRAQGHSAAVKETVGAALQGCRAPFRLVQDHSRSGRLEAPATALRSWLFTNDYAAYLSLIQGDGSDLVETKDYLEIEKAEAAKCRQLFDHIHSCERQNPVSLKALHERAVPYLQIRKALVSRLVSTAGILGLGQEAVHAGVGHMDRVMASGVFMTEAFQHLFICACLRMAAIQEGQPPPSPIAIQQLTCHPVGALERMEANIGQVLSTSAECITTIHCLKLYVQRLGCQLQDVAAVRKVAGIAFALAMDALYDLPVLQFPPSLLAAALLFTARKTQGSVPFWPAVLAQLTGCSEPGNAAFVAAISHAERLRTRLITPEVSWVQMGQH